jgi:hypothetical protein
MIFVSDYAVTADEPTFDPLPQLRLIVRRHQRDMGLERRA